MVKAEKRNGSYSVRVSLTDPTTGERTQKRVSARTKRELDVKVSDLKAKWNSGTYLEPSRETVASYLEHFVTTADIAPNTRRAYRTAINRLIVPQIGAVPLGKLTGRHVQDVYNLTRETTYGTQVQAVLSGALRLAVREGLVLRNVADGLTVGRSARETPDTPPMWTAEELAAFLAGVRGHRLWPLYWTAAHTGMRLSELINLRWDDVSLDMARLFVAKSKSASGRRRIALDAGTVAVLAEVLDDQTARRAALATDWQDTGAVFDRGDGRPLSPRTIEHVMTKAVERLGLPKGTPHTLRHTHTSLLLANGVPPHVVQARLGHASARTTLDVYAHVLPVSERDTADRFAAVLQAANSDQIVTNGGGAGRKTASA